jgi:regulator of protease activity HflC (stomatin/prohibitin superfamily)
MYDPTAFSETYALALNLVERAVFAEHMAQANYERSIVEGDRAFEADQIAKEAARTVEFLAELEAEHQAELSNSDAHQEQQQARAIFGRVRTGYDPLTGDKLLEILVVPD